MSALSNLKVGDNVTLFRHNIIGIAKVDRITNTGFIGVAKDLFDPKDGYKRGDQAWSRLYIEPTTQEHRDAVRRILLYRKLQATDFRKFSLEKLEEIVKIVFGDKVEE